MQTNLKYPFAHNAPEQLESDSAYIATQVHAARAAQTVWAENGFTTRRQYLSSFRDGFKETAETIAQYTSATMGMPITQARTATARAISYMDWSLANGETALAPITSFENNATQEINIITREPHGVFAAIGPWNFPASNFVWATFQALLAGNTVVYKAAPEVSACVAQIEHIATKHLPKDVLNFVYGSAAAGRNLINQDINFICFTGSTKAGTEIYKTAADKFIPCTLEMGGSDPAIVFPDADLDMTIPLIYAGRFGNCGQVCCAIKRLIVDQSIQGTVIEKLAAFLSTKKLGDPMQASTDIGPLVSEKQLSLLIEQVKDACEKGAQIICGGKKPSGLNGHYFEPTILTNVTEDMRVWHEEVFGPVLAVRTFETTEKAIELANDTIYGLGAAVFTQDANLAKYTAKHIRAGMVKINAGTYSKPENCFGGTKLSGLGRENGFAGFHDVTWAKVVAYT